MLQNTDYVPSLISNLEIYYQNKTKQSGMRTINAPTTKQLVTSCTQKLNKTKQAVRNYIKKYKIKEP